MYGYGMAGVGWLAVVLLWLIGLAALFGIVYAAVRLAALHALKAHTRWLDAGRPGGAAPHQPYPAAQQPYPSYPAYQPGRPGGQPAQPGYPPAQPGYPPAQPSPDGQPYPGYPGGQQYSAQSTHPTPPLPQPGPEEEPPGRPKV